MPFTTESEHFDEVDSTARPGGASLDGPWEAKVGSKSGYDVVTSAASPHSIKRPKRWDLFLLFNVAIPILLILMGALIYRMLGVAEAKPLPPPDTSPAAVLQGMPSARVERVRSLAETGQQLELVIDGTVVPFRESRVASEVAGRVIEKSANCEAGAIVREGEVLMKIDPQDYQLEVQRLESQREREYRAIVEVDQEMVNAKRSIDVARQDVKLQQQEVERQLALKKFASDSEVDRAKGALLQASQQLVTLENQLDLLGSRRSRLEAAEQLAVTQLRVAEVNLQRCEIVAPISGVIVSEEADLNTFVNRGTTLLTIEDISKVEVAASMRMDQLHWVLDQEHAPDRAGYDLPDTPAIIEYEIAGRQEKVMRWNGTLLSYDGVGIDPSTRTVPVRVLVQDPLHFVNDAGEVRQIDQTTALLRGMFVRVRLLLSPKSPLVVIPARALRPGNRVWKFVPDDAVLQQLVASAVAAKAAAADSASASETYTGSSDGDAVNRNSAVGDDPLSEGALLVENLIQAPEFNPAAWQSGLVKYSETVHPVDALRVSEPKQPDPNLAPALQSPDRIWVCEATRSDLVAGDYVVVSPLDSIPPQGLPVRAEIQK